jgi:hypothetical protein
MATTNTGIPPGAKEAQTHGAGPPGPVSTTVPAPAPGSASAVTDPGGSSPSPPKALGVVLVSAGVVGFILPGPGVPALVAGGMILWPDGFGKVEGWFRRRFPSMHRAGMGQIERFLSDLERRYPGSTGTRPGPKFGPASGRDLEPG